MTAAIKLTALRLAWLQYLADRPNGADHLDFMPKTRIGFKASRAMVWGALVESGFMEHDRGIFRITDTGRAVLAKALRAAAKQESDHAPF